MEYILVKAVGLIDSGDRARIITRELYNIMRPVHVQDPGEASCAMFGVMQHPTNTDQFALAVDTDELITVHAECNLEKLLAMFPELTADERYNLASAIHQLDEIPFNSILPSTVTVRDTAYMEKHGWILPEDGER